MDQYQFFTLVQSSPYTTSKPEIAMFQFCPFFGFYVISLLIVVWSVTERRLIAIIYLRLRRYVERTFWVLAKPQSGFCLFIKTSSLFLAVRASFRALIAAATTSSSPLFISAQNVNWLSESSMGARPKAGLLQNDLGFFFATFRVLK